MPRISTIYDAFIVELCLDASSHEVFLLGAAAIANITFMDPLSSDYLLQYNTVMVLVQCCTLQKAESLFAKDQVCVLYPLAFSLPTPSLKNLGVFQY